MQTVAQNNNLWESSHTVVGIFVLWAETSPVMLRLRPSSDQARDYWLIGCVYASICFLGRGRISVDRVARTNAFEVTFRVRYRARIVKELKNILMYPYRGTFGRLRERCKTGRHFREVNNRLDTHRVHCSEFGVRPQYNNIYQGVPV